MAFPAATKENPVAVAKEFLIHPWLANPSIIPALIGDLGDLQQRTLDTIEVNAAGRGGRRTSSDEWTREAQQIGEGLTLGRVIGALRQEFMIKG